MKKPRIQPAFASLTPAEIDQIAEWLRNDTYEVVLARVRRPRAEGGYGLNISRSPLARLHGKTNIVRKINEHLATGQQLTVSALDAINASEAPAPEAVHDAIMSATHELATSGDNTPSELRTLQTLADFPARAEIRAERHEILLAREERAQAKEERAAEMHTHKITIALARLELAKQSFAFRQQQHQDRLAHKSLIGATRSSSPTSTSRDAADSTAAAPAHPKALDSSLSQHGRGLGEGFNTESTSNSPGDPKSPNVEHPSPNPQPGNGEPEEEIPWLGPCPLPPEVVAENRRYAEKLRTGKIILDFSGDGVREIIVEDEKETSTPEPNPVGDDVRSPSASNSQHPSANS